MIAIAGAKGGCGKTTTALGLADAFAQAGTPTVVVDADRQLPNLHVVAGIDREPTIAALASGATISDVAHQHPDTDDVAVLTAPKSSQTIDLQTVLDRLADEPVQVLIDCPSGAGPDVVEPVAAADRIVVVTSDTGRSADAAETTIDVARRLDVPVAGTVFVRCDSVPADLGSRFDAPTLGVVPDHESPLTADATKSAYDRLAGALTESRGNSNSTLPFQGERLVTGVDAIDRVLDGGVRPGSIVALCADPASASELVLSKLTATRGTLYLSTQRSKRTVRHALETSAFRVGSPTIRHLDGSVIEQATGLVTALPDGANLIVDAANDLERSDRGAYIDFLNGVKEHLLETNSVAVFHCLSGAREFESGSGSGSGFEHGHRLVTRHHADVVVELEAIDRETAIDHVLSVSKRRGERPPTEKVPLFPSNVA
ncbi:DUF7125 family protein [Halomontanus rarus]|uniref:DUF7125 family protein n=1 Tax=Halomontanus rarus TaxID=3034020 RepID=UPI0023E896D1|nr:AAA family ATPase [Halovivax sp. TS33]